jgi:formylglycine-generating enzyme required for sulfatase activity
MVIDDKAGMHAEMVSIPAGSFLMGSDSGYGEERPVHSVDVAAFEMDSFPVTNRQYRHYCDMKNLPYPADPRWKELPGYFVNYPDHPVVNVSWEDASGYAGWAGKRLPNEAEWEYAARGGLAQQDFPWGPVAPDAGKANYADRDSTYPWKDFRISSGYRYTAPVGCFPANAFGLYDLAGNVWEWCEDWFFDYVDTVRDIAFLENGWGGAKICRGGCYHSDANDLRVARRHRILGGTAQIAVGFRCVRDGKLLARTMDDISPTAVPLFGLTKATPYDGADSLAPHDAIELCMGVGLLTPERARRIKNLGFTSVEQYVTWETIENAAEGNWDFTVWDAQVAMLKDAGLKWVPFLIAGPAYSLPDWFRETRDFQGLQCLEHGLESGIQSLWDENFHGYIDRFLGAFSDHYRDDPVIEAALLGISGDFGESIFPVWHGNWPTQIAGLYHSHAGYWCGDRFARRDFAAAMEKKYATIGLLNAAWGTEHPGFAAVGMPQVKVDAMEGFRVDEFTSAGKPELGSIEERRHWLDFIDWYRSSMTSYAEFWMGCARKHFPHKPIYLCTGGDAAPFHGSEFAAQAKMAARYGGGIRITNEASHFATNFSVTNWVSSAGNFYGSYSSFEPAGKVNGKGVLCRIYNATAAGARGLHFYEANIIGDAVKERIFRDNLKHLGQAKAVKEIGVLFPDVSLVLENICSLDFLKGFELFRDYSDFVFLDDTSIRDGILDTVRVAVICCGEIQWQATVDALQSWVERGGILAAWNIGGLRIAENNNDALGTLFASKGGTRRFGKGETLYIPVRVRIEPQLKESIIGTQAMEIRLLDSLEHLQKVVFDPLTDFLASHSIRIPDGQLDGAFAARFEDSVLWLNTGDVGFTRKTRAEDGCEKTIFLPGDAISEIKESVE